MRWIRHRRGETSRAISKLVPVLTGEVKLLSRNQLAGVKRSEMQALTGELETLRAFVRNAEAKSEEDNLWLVQLMEVAEFIEYVHRALQKKQWTTFLRKAAQLIGVFNSRPDLGNNLQNITALLSAINERGRVYKQLSYQIDAAAAVGLKLRSEELVQRLTGGESRRSVISLVGTSGVGKTTLARKVFADSEVRRCFDCFAWISVTRSYDFGEILRSLARGVGLDRPDMIFSMAIPKLIDALRSSLWSKVRYLFVFDDVWEDDFWQQIKPVLPDESNGSRVIVTTRIDTVARCCSETSFDHVQELGGFSIEDSFILFHSRVFGSSSCPDEELKEISYEFVRMCRDLPLAIVALAGVLSGIPKTVSEWKKVLRYLLSYEPRAIYAVLRFSFNSLPYNLKLCCLYLGILPKDSIIPNEKLVMLWIAEGFIEERYGGKTLEQVAEEYLDELVSRSFVIERKGFSQVHDLVFDFARNMCEEFNFPRYLSISRQVEEFSFPHYLSISDLLQDRLQGSVQNTSNVFWRNLRLSFDDGVDFVSRCSSSSNRCISDDDDREI